MIKENNNEKTKCSLRGERGAVAKAKPHKLIVVVVSQYQTCICSIFSL